MLERERKKTCPKPRLSSPGMTVHHQHVRAMLLCGGDESCALALVCFQGCDGHYIFCLTFSTQSTLKIQPCLAGHRWHPGSPWIQGL